MEDAGSRDHICGSRMKFLCIEVAGEYQFFTLLRVYEYVDRGDYIEILDDNGESWVAQRYGDVIDVVAGSLVVARFVEVKDERGSGEAPMSME